MLTSIRSHLPAALLGVCLCIGNTDVQAFDDDSFSEEMTPVSDSTAYDSDQMQNEILHWQASAESHNTAVSSLQIRTVAIQEAALSIASQTALALRTRSLQSRIERQASNLNDIFDFSALCLGQVLPPVITEANDLVVLDSDDTMRIAGRTYKIQQQARLITIAPTWRDYLLGSHFAVPPKPHPALLPQNAEESAIWREAVSKGWQSGQEQADEIMSIALSRLQRDWVGMVRYHLLFRAGQVSAPLLAKSSQGVTGNGQAMVLNDQIVRLTVKPTLSLDSSKWVALPQLPSLIKP